MSARLHSHVSRTCPGFFRSIALSSGNSLQDTLRLLTLWFKYGYDSNVDHAMTEGFGDVSIDTWLQVIPQVRPPPIRADAPSRGPRTNARSVLPPLIGHAVDDAS